MDKEKIYGILALIGIIAISYLLITKEKIDRTKCPYKIEGNITANLTIKYIDSPYCMWCWIEEIVLEKLLDEKGGSFKLEKYDINYCKDITSKYKFSGTPSFVFSVNNEEKEFTHSGYIPEEKFNQMICEVTGNCT